MEHYNLAVQSHHHPSALASALSLLEQQRRSFFSSLVILSFIPTGWAAYILLIDIAGQSSLELLLIFHQRITFIL